MMKRLIGADATGHGIARRALTGLFIACSIAACADPPAIGTAEQQVGTWQPTWGSVAQGVADPGVTIADIAVGGGNYTLFTASQGGVYSITGNPRSGFPQWHPVPGGVIIGAKASVTALPIGNGSAALFFVGPDAGVRAFTGSFEAGWADWHNVGTRTAAAGTTVAAVANGGGQFTLFMVGSDSAIYYCVWNNRVLVDWTRVGTGLARSGTSVTAVPTANGLFELFVIGTDNHVYSSFGSPTTSWTNWPIVSTGAGPTFGPIAANSSSPSVTVIADSNGNFTVFYVGADGSINPVTGNEQAWTSWSAVGGGSRFDAPITALPLANNRFALFVVGGDSNIYANTGAPSVGWFGWEQVSGVTAGAGTSVTAARVGGTFDLYVPSSTTEVRDNFGTY